MGDSDRQDRDRSWGQDWDKYWQGAQRTDWFGQFGPREALKAHWTDVFTRVLADRPGRRVHLDLACGSGAIASVAHDVAGQTGHAGLDHIGLDIAPHAMLPARAAPFALKPVVASAAQTPFPNGTFDIVTSQFGLEYAGPGAFAEAVRLVAPGGVFSAVCHLKGGSMHEECARHHTAIEALKESGFIGAARALFTAGFARDGGAASGPGVEVSVTALNEAAKRVEAIIQTHGSQVAGGFPARLYSDIKYMVGRRRGFRPDEVFAWLDGNERELISYGGRMASMTAAAQSADAMGAARETVEAAGFTVSRWEPRPLLPDEPPAAWIIEAFRPHR